MTQDELDKAIRADDLSLLDSQLSNLSQRVFEVGRQADRCLTLWLAFAALTLLFAFGMTEKASLGGVEINTRVGATIFFALSCMSYYRATLSTAALSVWRTSRRERRARRYGSVLNAAGLQGQAAREATLKEMNGYIPEFPGYVACSVLLKDEAKQHRGLNERYVRALHYAVLLWFLLSPYALAIAVVVQAGWEPFAISGVVLGLLFTLTGNAFIRFIDRGSPSMPEAGGGNGKGGTPNAKAQPPSRPE